jgi:guanine deaminase
MAQGHRIGLATDTGGGSSFSMLRTMAAAYEVAQLRGTALHPAQLLWLATQGSARALRMDDRIGNIAPGMEADLVVLDLASTPAIAQRAGRGRQPLGGGVSHDHDGRRPRGRGGNWVGGRRVGGNGSG